MYIMYVDWFILIYGIPMCKTMHEVRKSTLVAMGRNQSSMVTIDSDEIIYTWTWQFFEFYQFWSNLQGSTSGTAKTRGAIFQCTCTCIHNTIQYTNIQNESVHLSMYIYTLCVSIYSICNKLYYTICCIVLFVVSYVIEQYIAIYIYICYYSILC